jgi:hypothetical protein
VALRTTLGAEQPGRDFLDFGESVKGALHRSLALEIAKNAQAAEIPAKSRPNLAPFPKRCQRATGHKFAAVAEVALAETTRVVRGGGLVAVLENDTLHVPFRAWSMELKVRQAEI